MDAEHSVDDSQALLEQVNRALANATPLLIQGSNSKAFLGRAVAGEVLDTRSHRGIVSYDPTELVITVRAGTLWLSCPQPWPQPGRCCPVNRRPSAREPQSEAWSLPACRARAGPGPARCATSSSAPG